MIFMIFYCIKFKYILNLSEQTVPLLKYRIKCIKQLYNYIKLITLK